MSVLIVLWKREIGLSEGANPLKTSLYSSYNHFNWTSINYQLWIYFNKLYIEQFICKLILNLIFSIKSEFHQLKLYCDHCYPNNWLSQRVRLGKVGVFFFERNVILWEKNTLLYIIYLKLNIRKKVKSIDFFIIIQNLI